MNQGHESGKESAKSGAEKYLFNAGLVNLLKAILCGSMLLELRVGFPFKLVLLILNQPGFLDLEILQRLFQGSKLPLESLLLKLQGATFSVVLSTRHTRRGVGESVELLHQEIPVKIIKKEEKQTRV